MVDILAVMLGVVKKFNESVPNTKHYLGRLPEKFATPCFLYSLVFNSDKQFTKFTKDVTLDLQIIYFNDVDAYNVEDFEKKLGVMRSLKNFLSQFNLQVEDRNIKFDYSFGEADGQLSINMNFKFKDGVIDLKYNEEQAREMIETVYINEKEVI